ncbi:hypothetical protein [Saccharolobus caldissimus]|uniref:Uncharacterized protein n=1 Tax=Saccharolobus caldissimus TaxID=1702097 RepID=A0AAQ4CUM0_9CREN|nr:hypothetical protein [Saccharolobus caldissimus]BDB99501.1 hypothetical protein SACC_25180 [Saccharolobus caldissimus]
MPQIEPYRALVHIASIGILFAAILYFLQYIKNALMYYLLFISSIIFISILIYYLVYKPIVNSKYFKY